MDVLVEKAMNQVVGEHSNVRDLIERVGLKLRVLKATFKRGKDL